jgi:tetratricopeptide (TPR) repeat protein
MFRYPRISAVLAAILLLVAGCATTTVTQYSIGKSRMEQGRLDAAIAAFDSARVEDPSNPAVVRDLGIAWCRKGQFARAIPILRRAFDMDARDGATLFHLGTACEITKDYAGAMDMYRRFTDVESDQKLRACLEARLDGLLRKQIRQEAKATLAEEKAVSAAAASDSAVAVLPFRNAGKKRNLDPIQKGLADMLITDLSKVRRLTVVERARFAALAQEMNLAVSGLVDDGTAPRVGRLLGASTVVHGSFLDLPKDGVRIDADLLRPKGRKAFTPGKVQGKMEKFFALEKDLVFTLVDRMGISLSQDEKDDIRVIPTENLLAFLAYCRGLDLEDQGQFEAAGREYRKAAELDSKFKKAAEAASRAESLTLSETNMTELEAMYTAAFAPAKPEPEPAPAKAAAAGSGKKRKAPASKPAASAAASASDQTARVERMMHTADMLDRGFLPGVDSREPLQEGEQPAFGNSAGFELTIPLPQE